jgi:hypothetical protein
MRSYPGRIRGCLIVDVRRQPFARGKSIEAAPIAARLAGGQADVVGNLAVAKVKWLGAEQVRKFVGLLE